MILRVVLRSVFNNVLRSVFIEDEEQTFESYMQNKTTLVWYRFDEDSGTTAEDDS